MKKITLSILMTIGFFLFTHSQVDRLIPADIVSKSNLSDSETLKQLNDKIQKHKLNFNPIFPTKVSPIEALSFPKSIPYTKSPVKKLNNNIPSVAERRNRFNKKRRNRATYNSKSNSNSSSYDMSEYSIDVLRKLSPYMSMYNNDLMTFDMEESAGNYIDLYTYFEDGSVETEKYYEFDADANNYALYAAYAYQNSYDSAGNLTQRILLIANLETLQYENSSAVVYVYENNLPTQKYSYQYDYTAAGFKLYALDSYYYNEDNLISSTFYDEINDEGTTWVKSERAAYTYVNGMLDVGVFYNYSSESDNYQPSFQEYYYFNTAGQYIQLIFLDYDSTLADFVPLAREDYAYHSGEIKESVIESFSDFYVSDDGTMWVEDEFSSMPTIYRGYGDIETYGSSGSYNSSGEQIDVESIYQLFSYTPPATITPNYTETFNSFLPESWEVAQGDYGTPIGVKTQFFAWDFGNDSGNSNGKAALINIYESSVADYLFSPVFDLSGGTHFLNYDIALTKFGVTESSTLGSDDYVAVLVTQDRGVSWAELARWTADTEISNEGQSAAEISLSGYGNEVQFAFYANSGADDPGIDNDFFIDNFQITSETLGTASNILEGFTMYPTIVKQELNFRSQNKVEAITVFNLLGQKVFFDALDTNNSSVNLSKLTPGMYIVKVSAEGKTGSYKIVKE